MLDTSATGRAARRQARIERNEKIRQERSTGKTLDVISGLFGVCHETIRKVCKGQAPLPASVVATNSEKAAEAKRTARAERNHKIIEASQSGRSVPSIAREHGLRVQTVEAVLFNPPPGIDPKPRRGLPPTEAVLKRVRNVHLARQAGATYGQIEARFSLSPTKIRSILHPPRLPQ